MYPAFTGFQKLDILQAGYSNKSRVYIIEVIQMGLESEVVGLEKVQQVLKI